MRATGEHTQDPPTTTGQEGSAIVVTLWVVMIGLAFAGVSGVISGNAVRGVGEDKQVKSAGAAADAGVERAVFRYNKVSLGDELPCVIENADGDLVAGGALADGWCPAQSQDLNGGSFTYRAKREVLPAPDNLLRLTVVATGSAQGETRRIKAVAEAPSSAAPFGDDAIRSVNELAVDNQGRIDGNAASNADVNLYNQSEICGDATPGPTGQVGISGSATICSGGSTAPAASRFPVSAADPGDVHTGVNDNGRFFGEDSKTGNVTWDASTRSLTLGGSGSLTLGGDRYSLCRLEMSGSSSLIVANGASPRAFFDSPESCGLSQGDTQLGIGGSAAISNTDIEGAIGLQLYLLGSPSIDTVVSLAGTASVLQKVVVHAPRNEVQLAGNGVYTGAVLGGEVTVEQNVEIVHEAAAESVEIEVIPLYMRQVYVLCQGAGGSTPDDGC